jgi:hypothetical protein
MIDTEINGNLIKTEILSIQQLLSSAIVKTDNAKIRQAYTLIYTKLKSAINNSQILYNTPTQFLLNLKNEIQQIDPEAQGCILKISFIKNANYTHFVHLNKEINYGD